MQLTELERNDIICALEIASEQYSKDAQAMRHSNQPMSLIVQLEEQAKRAEKLIDRIADTI